MDSEKLREIILSNLFGNVPITYLDLRGLSCKIEDK